MDPTLLPAFLLGLLGSAHCLGMCGGIVGALTLRLPQDVQHSPRRLLPYALCYNAGRIASYVIAGMLAGLIGAQLLERLVAAHAELAGRLVSSIFLVALGLYIAGWTRLLVPLERAGARFWRLIEPLGRRLLPISRPPQALVLGLLWGWLPCGLVYGALALALAAGSAPRGAALMFAFGLGTLPMLLAMGTAAGGLSRIGLAPAVRGSLGAVILIFAAVHLFAPGSHEHTPVQASAVAPGSASGAPAPSH